MSRAPGRKRKPRSGKELRHESRRSKPESKPRLAMLPDTIRRCAAGNAADDGDMPGDGPTARDSPPAKGMAVAPPPDRHAEAWRVPGQRHCQGRAPGQRPERPAGCLARPILLPHPGEDREGCLALWRAVDGEPGRTAQANAEVADLLSQLQSGIEQTYAQAAIDPGCQTLCQMEYASIPGWCDYNQCAIPDSYYSNDSYVGPAFSAGYAGSYAIPVYNTFYNPCSRYNFWNHRACIHNNFTRTGGHGALRAHPRVVATAGQRSVPITRPNGTLPAVRRSGATLLQHANRAVVRQASRPGVVSHPRPAAQASHAAHAVARPAIHAQSRPAAHVQARPAAHAQSRPAAHVQSRPAAHVQARPAAHVQSRPAAHVQSRPAAHAQSPHAGGGAAHASSGGGRHR